MRDQEIREKLRQIDSLTDIDVTTFEADFLESVLFKYDGPLSRRQRDVGTQMIQKYLYGKRSNE